MRLTLRALLAYLYNVLEPADANDFSTKVQESAVASGLVQRIGAITKKMRMNAPRIDAKGMADDANNVAEYLDNSLPEEQVGDFERACINSDQHLAEVASSYQILTMVLGKAADVPDSLQTRVYRLPLDLATTHKDNGGDADPRKRLKKTIEKVAQSARETDAGLQSVHTGSTHPVAEVPDYLRGGQGNLGKWLAVAAVALLIAAIGIFAAGPLDESNGIIGWMFKKDVDVADLKVPDTSSAAPDPAADPAATPTSEPATDSKASDAADSATATDTTDDKTAAAKTRERTGDKTGDDTSAEASPGPPVPPVEPEPASSATSSDTKETSKTGEKVADAAATPDPSVKPPPPVDPMDVGRYVSDDQVLTRFDSTSELWFLVPPRAILSSGERLVVLPTYRPQVALASGVQVTFAGESEVQMQEPKNSAASRMSVAYGRLVMVTLGNAGAQVELDFGGVQGTLTLEESDTVVAIDARHFLPPGSSPDKDERIQVIELYAAHGKIRWEEAGAGPLDIPAQQVLTYVAGSERELTGPFEAPEWIDAVNLTQIDRYTSPVLQRELPLDKPVHIRLQELMSDRRAEVRALASRCLAQLGEFDPVVRELGNSQQKSFWAAEVEILRQSLTRGTEASTRIRQSLDSLYPKDADAIFRVLWGYSPEQLGSGGAKELVQLLDSPEMALRVVAIDTLRQITGAQLLYRPEKVPSENRAAIVRWSEREKDGSIAYKSAPAPFGERKPLGAAPAEETKAPTTKGPATKAEEKEE